jgi:hypothetical protein
MIHSAPPRRQGITHAKPFGRDTFADNDEDDLAAMMHADAIRIRQRRQREGLEKAGRTEPPPHVEQPWMVLADRIVEHLRAGRGRTICAGDLRKDFDVKDSQAANVMRHLRTSGKIIGIGRGDYVLSPQWLSSECPAPQCLAPDQEP